MGEAIISRRGGGVALNFKVIAVESESALPPVAKANTVAVITSTPITSWQIGGEQPISPEEGFVWFSEFDTKLYPFNMLKKNGVYISPGVAQQYVSGTWKIVKNAIYDGTKWVGLSLELYTPGDMHTNTTGGWVKGYVHSGTSMTISDSSTGLVYTASASVTYPGGYTTLTTNNTVNITDYNTLSFTLTNNGNAGVSGNHLYVGCTHSKGTPSVSGDEASAFSCYVTGPDSGITVGTPITYTVDVSSVSGSYYISVALYPSNPARKFTLTNCILT